MALEREKNKLVREKCQTILTNLLQDEDNKYCVDCDAKSPRWASWNIGIFLCIRCAGIHRNLGVHISKVKSVTLDSWTPQQVACIQQMGNSRARAVFEANLQDNFRRPQIDSALEQFIRAKYEAKKYIAREWVPPAIPTPTWDLEIEKQLKKKKEKKSVSGSTEFPVPVKNSTPKSSGVSPKPLPKAPGGRNSSPCQAKRTSTSKKESSSDKENTSSGMIDLLGLDVPSTTNGSVEGEGDIFGDFLAAPMSNSTTSPTPEGEPVTKDLTQNEESNFFNQKLPETSAEKLSKDSILALYKQTPPHPQPQVQPQQLYGGGGGGGMHIGAGVMPMAVPQPGMGVTLPPQQQPQQQNRMFFQQPTPGVGIQPQFHSQGVPTMGPQGIPAIGMPMYPAGAGGVQLSAANPFAQMQMQMGNMSLAGMTGPAQPQPTLAHPLCKGNIMGVTNLSSNPTQTNTLSNNLWQ